MFHLLFGFQGRIGRGMWWLAQLVAIPVVWLVGGTLAFGGGMSGLGTDNPEVSNGLLLTVGLLGALLIGIWINVASTVKRFHDRGKSGFWFFIVFVPFIGGIWQLIECGFCSGDDGDNDYGSPPGSGRSAEGLDREIRGLAAASNGRLAKLDDDYFKNYAAQMTARPAVAQGSSYRASTPMNSGPTKPVFGRR